MEEQVNFLQLDLRCLLDPPRSAFLPALLFKDNNASKNYEITLHFNGNNYN